MSVLKSIKEKIRPVKDQIKTFIAPVTDKIRPYLQPFRTRWAAFSSIYPRVAKVVKYSCITIMGIFGSIFAIMFLIWIGFFGGLPSKTSLKNYQNALASEVYSSDNKLLGRYYIQNRTEVEYNDISKHVVNALVATEDSRYWEHGGIDLISWGRVLIKSLLMRDASQGGGSTLSQQVAKNIFPRKNYWIFTMPINKIREFMIAQRLEKIYNKKDLLAFYLNTVSFSENVFGIDIAAKRFFSTNAKELTPEQAALLVGMVKATTYYSPVKNPERALKRRNTVLGRMRQNNYLTEEEANSCSKKPLGIKYTKETISDGPATYFREMLRLELDELLKNYKKPDGKPYNIYTDGLKIHTTIDSRMQEDAEESMHEHMTKLQKTFESDWKYAKPKEKPWENDTIMCEEVRKNKRYANLLAGKIILDKEAKKVLNKPNQMTIFDWKTGLDKDTTMSPLDSVKYYFKLLNAGFMAMEPQSGAIKAWVGGINHKYFKYDHVKSKRQCGSTFKPILYTRALQAGISPCEYWLNRPKVYHEWDDWTPQNSEGEIGGMYSMEGALTNSFNVIAARMIMKAGIDETADLAKKFGITSKIPKVPSLALGTVEVSLFDMMKVFGTFPNRGLRPDPRFIDKIETADGKTIVAFAPTTKDKLERVMNDEECDIMTHLMKAVVDKGTGSRMRSRYDLRNDLGGKTGTTQSHADGWFICYSPTLVTGAWVGAETPQSHFRTLDNGQGASSALPLCGLFLKKIYANEAFKKIPQEKFLKMSDAAAAKVACAMFMYEPPRDSSGHYIRRDTSGGNIDATPPPLNPEDIKEDIN